MILKQAVFMMFAFLSGAAVAGGSTSAGPAHPSGQYCLDHGGRGVLVSTPLGQSSLCRLSDDAMISAMTFWRNAQEETMALQNFRVASWHPYPVLPTEEWARQNCQDRGGTLNSVSPNLRPSVVYEMCEFSDQSSIEIWTLFAGPSVYPELAK